MQERSAPQVTVHGQRAVGRVADVIGSGSDDERPTGRRCGLTLGAGLAALVLAGVTVAQRGGDDPVPTTPPPSDLVLVETGAGLSTQWGYGGRLDVSLPLLIRNDGGPMTISSVALDGTSLVQPAVDVPVVPGGRLPVTLRQSRACVDVAPVSADAALRLEVRRGEVAETRWLALPDGVVQSLAGALAAQCAAVPLEQALFLTSEEEQVLTGSVDVRVRAHNISGTSVQLLSVQPARGLSVALAPTPDAMVPPSSLPLILGLDPLSLRLSVAVEDCGVVATLDLARPVAIADVTYDDGVGDRTVKAVVGDFPGLRRLVESTC